MDSTYFMIFMILIAVVTTMSQVIRLGKYRVLKNKLDKGGLIMTKEIIEKMIGKQFGFSTGSFGSTYVKGTVLSVNDKWIEVQTKKEIRFLNADFILEIREIK